MQDLLAAQTAAADRHAFARPIGLTEKASVRTSFAAAADGREQY